MCETSAYHEAGHAFMAIYVGARVRSVTIEPDHDEGPRRHADIQIEWPIGQFGKRESIEKAIMVALAGPVAEMIYTGEPYHPGLVAEWSADWKMAWDAASGLVNDERKRLAFLEQSTLDLKEFLSDDRLWAVIAAIVDDLAAHETLEGDEVESIVRQWM